MGREVFDSVTARIPARIASALSRGRELSESRRLSHETGHVVDHPDILPADEPHVVYECTDLTGGDNGWLDEVVRYNDIYNTSVSTEWMQIDPAEDRIK